MNEKKFIVTKSQLQRLVQKALNNDVFLTKLKTIAASSSFKEDGAKSKVTIKSPTKGVFVIKVAYDSYGDGSESECKIALVPNGVRIVSGEHNLDNNEVYSESDFFEALDEFIQDSQMM